MGSSNDLYAESILPDASLPAVFDIGPHAGAYSPIAFPHVAANE